MLSGAGVVVTGTIHAGEIKVDDRLVLTPSGLEARVRSLHAQNRPAEIGRAGERCALNVTGADVAQIHRGDWVVAPAIHAPTQRLDVRLQLLAGETQPLKHWTPVHLHLGTADVTARIAIRRGASVAPGASAIVQVIADKPIAALNGDRFIIRDQSAMRTIGGGTVIDPFVASTRRNAQARAAHLAALENADPAAALAALLAGSPAGVDLTQFERAMNLTPDRAAQLTHKPEIAIVGKEQRVALPRTIVDGIKQSAVDALTRFHRESPQATGFEVSTLRKQLAPALPAATFTALLRELGDEKKIEVAGSSARLPRHVATDNPADEKMWQALKPLLDNAGFNVPPLRELAPAANLKEAILKDFLHRKARTSEVIRVTPERFYPRATLAQLAAVAQVVTQTVPGGQFTAAQYRDATGVGRGLAIEIRECLDRLGITQRIGTVDAGAGQCDPHACFARQTRQGIAAADIGKQADPHFGHRKRPAVSGNPVAPMQRYADTAAHHNAVDQRQIGFGIEFDAGVEPVFIGPEAHGNVLAALLAQFDDRADIAARAKGFLALGIQHDAGHIGIMFPRIQSLRDCMHHRQGQGIECLGAVEVDQSG